MPMLDFIIALIVLAGLVWAFSGLPVEEAPSQADAMYMPGAETAPILEVVSPSGGKQSLDLSLALKPIDKRPETSEPVADNSSPTKTIEELAWEVIVGLWGYMDDRWQRLTDAGYDAAAVQARVNELMKQFT